MLVASDAVGMGLNLNIRRVIFHSVAKRAGEPAADIPLLACLCLLPGLRALQGKHGTWLPHAFASNVEAAGLPIVRAGGSNLVPVSTSMMKQIAGRAGRRSSQWPNGLATCRNPADVARLQEALAVRRGTAAVVLLS